MADFNIDEMIEKIKTGANKVTKNAEKFTKTASAKVGNMTREAKLKYALKDVEDRIDEAYMEIGKAVYYNFKNNEDEAEHYEIFGKIDALTEEATEIKETIASIRNSAVCPSCSGFVNEDDVYCSKCGAKLK